MLMGETYRLLPHRTAVPCLWEGASPLLKDITVTERGQGWLPKAEPVQFLELMVRKDAAAYTKQVSVVTLGKKLHVGAEAGAQGETSYPPSPLHQFFLTKPIEIGNALIHRHGPH